jgi:hypothetical protein
VIFIVLLASPGPAQTVTTESVLRQALMAHVGPGGLPADLLIQGQLTNASDTRPLRMQVKGKDKIRYELGLTARQTVSIYNAGSGWAGSNANVKPVAPYVALRRPMELPFLDVIDELGDPRLTARYIGLKVIGQTSVHHIALRLSDPAPRSQRFLNRPLDEEVELFIDVATNLIVRSQRMQVADNSMDFRVPSILDFSDYRQVGGLMIPFRIVNTIGTPYSGMGQSTLVFQSVVVNPGIPDSVFQPQ